MSIAGARLAAHTEVMSSLRVRGPLYAAIVAMALCSAGVAVRADEIRLKDGKKLYGVIVAYEDNMFKVKTDFGYVLVEKDKIASIIPSTPPGETPKSDKAPAASEKKPLDGQPKAEPAVASAADGNAAPAPTNASAKSVDPVVAAPAKPSPKITSAPVKPQIPAAAKSNTVAPSMAAPSAPAGSVDALSASAQPSAPREPEPPAMREGIQGNLYTNYTHGFRMYKAPSWQLIEDARQGLPNAIVAMGSYNRQTLLVVGKEDTTDPLDTAAKGVEKRLSEIYDNYRRISEKKTTVGGLPAVEYHYRGMADDHDWSGTLVVIARDKDVFTALGMTYADNDLIQIQENVIERAIASLDFSVH
jgi:hypothetical protein